MTKQRSFASLTEEEINQVAERLQHGSVIFQAEMVLAFRNIRNVERKTSCRLPRRIAAAREISAKVGATGQKSFYQGATLAKHLVQKAFSEVVNFVPHEPSFGIRTSDFFRVSELAFRICIRIY